MTTQHAQTGRDGRSPPPGAPVPDVTPAAASDPATSDPATSDPTEASTAELVRRLSTHLSELVRGELDLAEVEPATKGKRAGAGAGLAGAGGVVALFAPAALIAAGIAGLATAMPVRPAALIGGVVLLLVAGVLALVGRNTSRVRYRPFRSRRSTASNATWRPSGMRCGDERAAMNETASGSGPASEDRSPAQVRQDLDELRGELGDTVEELANRVDVPARARAARDDAVQRARRHVAHVQDVVAQRAPGAAATMRERPGLVGGIAGLVLALPVLGGIRRRRAGAR